MNLRIDKRVYKAVITGIATLTSRGASVIVSLLSIPILAGYLGTERFGLWLIFSTLMGWILIFDLGIANSITNVISSSDTENNKDKIRM